MDYFDIVAETFFGASSPTAEMSQNPDLVDSGAKTAITIVAIVATLTGVSAMFVAARLFVRIKLRSLGLDDYLISLAMVSRINILSLSLSTD